MIVWTWPGISTDGLRATLAEAVCCSLYLAKLSPNRGLNCVAKAGGRSRCCACSRTIWKTRKTRDWYENAGGDRQQIFPLTDELAPRTLENSQPVVFAPYNRAVGLKVVASVIDGNHDGIDSSSLSRFLVEQGIERPMVARRLPDNEGLLGRLPGARFRLLEEATDSEGRSFRMPTFIANYYVTAWFDLHLRSDASAMQRLLNPPFADHVVMRQSGLNRP